jgi:3-phenylpropionate/trans-cinnamate dioxygenase ferredoxin reductase subunit
MLGVGMQRDVRGAEEVRSSRLPSRSRRFCSMASRQVDYLLIGGGLASANCARWLREESAEGTVLLVGREPDPPYNRPNCSKGYLRGAEERSEAFFRPPEWWGEQQVELLTRTSVTALDAAARVAKLSNKEDVEFGQALLATGANVRRLNVEGCHLQEIHYLRTLSNADAIRVSVADAERVVLIGGSYIGCEVAASLTMLGKQCTIVMQEDVTLQRGFGAATGRFFEELLQSHGVTIHGRDELDRFEGDERVAKVITKGGLELDADAVVIGAGVAPDVRLARGAGLGLGESGGVRCDSRLRTSAPGIFAAGDICEYDSPLHDGPLRVEHWDVAFNHGKTAALNMLGRDVPHETVPYFFSVLGDWAELEYVGPAREWDEEIVRGTPAEHDFTTWYLRDGRLLAALTVGRSDDLDHARRLLAERPVLDDAQRRALADTGSDLDAIGR